MAIVFLFIGIAAIAIGVRGQSSAAGQLLASEFTGTNSFIQWLAAIVILGVIGFYRPFRPAANAMLGLVILAMFLKKGQGFFDQINSALTSATPAAAPKATTPATPTPAGPATTAGNDAATGITLIPPANGTDWLNPETIWPNIGIGGFASDLTSTFGAVP